VDTEFVFSGAHRVRFSGVYGRLHGHNWVIRVRVCVRGRRDLVMDIDEFRSRLLPVINKFESRYLKSPGESRVGLGDDEYVELECMEEGVTSECLSWYLLGRVEGVLASMGIGDVEEIQVRSCDSSVNCFEAIKSS
jgi:6-pyruvoyl-tetrahydropterin synthase